MTRILIACWGSHGDVDPYVGLGIGLTGRGHNVTIATQAHFEPLVRSNGLGFTPLRPNVGPSDTEVVRRIMHPSDGSRYVTQDVVFKATDEMYADLRDAAEAADLVITHPLTGVAALHAERQDKPWASTTLAPLSFFSEYEPPILSQLRWLKHVERVSSWPSRWVVRGGKRVTLSWCQPLSNLRQRLGLADRGNALFDGQHSPHLVLALWSRILSQPQPDWPANVVVTGHMCYDASHGSELSPELEAFIGAGEPPIVFTLGSSAVLNAGTFWRESALAVEQLGARAVFLVGKGHAAFSSKYPPPNILSIESAPHSLLMPRAAAVVHQCGVGTLAQGLRSGRPVLAVPFAHDQPDNAWRAARLGTARVLHATRYTARRAANELRHLLSVPSYVQNAQAVATTVRSERGIEAACNALEATFNLH